ncbi:MAG: hypothetical protein AAGG75_13785 [Bacteroidota bacterium]
MSNNILDDLREPVKAKYSQQAFRSAKIAWGLIILLFLISGFTAFLSPATWYPIPSILMLVTALASFVVAVAGLIQSIKSYIGKEPASTKRGIALIGNFIIVAYVVFNIVINVIGLVRLGEF